MAIDQVYWRSYPLYNQRTRHSPPRRPGFEVALHNYTAFRGWYNALCRSPLAARPGISKAAFQNSCEIDILALSPFDPGLNSRLCLSMSPSINSAFPH